MPDSAFTRDDRYRADTRQGVAVEYVSCEPTGNACEMVDEDCELVEEAQ